MFDAILTAVTLATGSGVVAPAVQAPDYVVSASALVAEDQTPTGKFTTATEIKPIITMTQGNWVAVREWDGQDLIYVSHLWAWRCGLVQIEISINGGDAEVWPLPPCHEDTAQPNAIIESDGLPYRRFELKSIETLDVTVTFDDLTTQSASFERKNVLLP